MGGKPPIKNVKNMMLCQMDRLSLSQSGGFEFKWAWHQEKTNNILKYQKLGHHHITRLPTESREKEKFEKNPYLPTIDRNETGVQIGGMACMEGLYKCILARFGASKSKENSKIWQFFEKLGKNTVKNMNFWDF